MSSSTFTWLDYDAEQARRSAELIRSLSEPDTVDSLGLGAIRDGFAGILFPGTSTVQTRARYFLLVPWALEHAASRRPRNRQKFSEFVRDAEVRTITALLDGNPGDKRGIVGQEKRGKTIRMPSSIYWAGLEAWGIRTEPGLTLTGFGDAVLGRRRAERLDGEEGDGAFFQVFDEMPSAPPGFPDEPLAMLPGPDEADYLLARMASTRVPRPAPASVDGGPSRDPSLLAVLAKNPTVAEVPHPWDVPRSLLTAELIEVLQRAQAFSLVMQGARLRYLDLLFRARAADGLAFERQREELNVLISGWFAAMGARASEAEAWAADLAGMWSLLDTRGIRIQPPTRGFVGDWAVAAVADPEAAMASSGLADVIRNRESLLKGPGARLTNEAPLTSWEGSLLGSAAMDFRWGVARGHLLDCRDGRLGSAGA